MRYRFTAGEALLGALALSLMAALVPVPAQAEASGPAWASSAAMRQGRGRAARVASRCGRGHVWPGGTVGFTALPPQDLANGTWQLALSWGSAVARRHRPPSEILSSVASYPGQG
jgi:hypothetical protein